MIFTYSWPQYIVSNKQFPKSIYCHVVNDQVTSLCAFIVPVAARNLHIDISPLMDNKRNRTLFDISTSHGYTGIYSECIIARWKWTSLALSNLVASYYIYVISTLRTLEVCLRSNASCSFLCFYFYYLYYHLVLYTLNFPWSCTRFLLQNLIIMIIIILICFDWKTAC